MKRSLMAAVIVLGFTGSAFAQTENTLQEPDRVKYRENTQITFGELTLDGVRDTSITSALTVRRGAKFENLIKVRVNFVPELQGSVDNL